MSTAGCRSRVHRGAACVAWRFALAFAAVLGATPATPADAAPRDIVLMLDNSGSMRANDPDFLTRLAVRAFLEGLEGDNRVAVVAFDQRVNVLMPLTPLNNDTRWQFLEGLDAINYRGLLTNSPAALERSLYELRESGRPGAEKSIVFMTDGIVDVAPEGPDAGDVEKGRWMKSTLVQEAADQGVRIFGIAFTDNADFELIQTLARRTGGEYFRAYSASDIDTVFASLRELLSTAGGSAAHEPAPAPPPIAAIETPPAPLPGSDTTTLPFAPDTAPEAEPRAPLPDSGAGGGAAPALTPPLETGGNLPAVSLPEFSLPEVDLPKVNLPEVNIGGDAQPAPPGGLGDTPPAPPGGLGDTPPAPPGESAATPVGGETVPAAGSPDAPPPTDDTPLLLILGMGGAALLLALVALIVVLARRKSASSRSADPLMPKAFLNDLGGITEQQSYELDDKPTIIGRLKGPATDAAHYILIDESTVGRRHAMFEYKDHAFWVSDQNSLNGTFVNNRRIEEPTRLKHGDRVRFHKHEFEFLVLEMFETDRTMMSNTMFADLADDSGPIDVDDEDDATEVRNGESASRAPEPEDPTVTRP